MQTWVVVLARGGHFAAAVFEVAAGKEHQQRTRSGAVEDTGGTWVHNTLGGRGAVFDARIVMESSVATAGAWWHALVLLGILLSFVRP